MLALLISGCAGAGSGLKTVSPQNESTVIITDDDGGHVAVNVTHETGAIAGRVRTDAGTELPAVQVDILGTDLLTRTNSTGWFQFTSLKPSDYRLHAAAQGFRAAESLVNVTAGAVTSVIVTMLAAGDGAERAHSHDYWSGRAEMPVLDADFDFYPSPNGAADAPARVIGLAVSTANGLPCVSFPKAEAPQAGVSREFWFSEPTQTVWPGTSRIDVAIVWTSADYVGGSTVGVAWRGGNTREMGANWSGPLTTGKSFSIPVDAQSWDSGHQPSTLWRFWLCLNGKGEGTTNGRAFVGKFHAKATLVRGWPIYVEPPHPRFWDAGNTVRVLDGWRNFTCASPDAASSCEYAMTGSRARYPAYFAFAPPPPVLVPPGTARIRANLSWTYDGPASNKPLGLAFSPANVAPHDKGDAAKYHAGVVADKATNLRGINYELKPGESDQFYQRFSNWVVLWGYEGEETQPTLSSWCGCQLTMHVTLDAVRDPA